MVLAFHKKLANETVSPTLKLKEGSGRDARRGRWTEQPGTDKRDQHL